MPVIVGETKTRFWYGEKYIFKRIARGEWICIYQDHPILPYGLIESLGE